MRVPVSLAPLILAGLRKTKSVTGWPGLVSLVWECRTVLVMVAMVLLRFIICRRSLLLSRRSPRTLDRISPSIGTFAYPETTLVTLVLTILL